MGRINLQLFAATGVRVAGNAPIVCAHTNRERERQPEKKRCCSIASLIIVMAAATAVKKWLNKKKKSIKMKRPTGNIEALIRNCRQQPLRSINNRPIFSFLCLLFCFPFPLLFVSGANANILSFFLVFYPIYRPLTDCFEEEEVEPGGFDCCLFCLP